MKQKINQNLEYGGNHLSPFPNGANPNRPSSNNRSHMNSALKINRMETEGYSDEGYENTVEEADGMDEMDKIRMAMQKEKDKAK